MKCEKNLEILDIRRSGILCGCSRCGCRRLLQLKLVNLSLEVSNLVVSVSVLNLYDVPPLRKDGQSYPGSLQGTNTEVITHNTSHTRIKQMKCSES
jgi:hypothetical protein